MDEKFLSELGVKIPNVLLPKEGTDLTKWAVVACDQFTSQKDYWDQVESLVGENPSTLRITLPEIYLEDNKEERISNINETMCKYMEDGVLEEREEGFVYVERTLNNGKIRRGLVLAMDLEKYDYNKGSQTLIRATEGTIIDRLPPRIQIRENAPIELPHIMVLIDDPERTVIEPISADKEKLMKLYDFDLMMNGGHLNGYFVDDEELFESIRAALSKLADSKVFQNKYGVGEDKGVLLFAMGDGNHSLATAKAIWDKVKASLSEADKEDHPARFALVEIVNVHDEGLDFEPIHRVVFNGGDELMSAFYDYSDKEGLGYAVSKFDSYEEMQTALSQSDMQALGYVKGSEFGLISFSSPKLNLAVGTLQVFLDEYIKETGLKIDYIHGDDVVTDLGSKDSNVGFYLPVMSKSDLFKTVILDGALPRKTFSMGEGKDKRYYMEARRIK